jgi:hypothetical protein
MLSSCSIIECIYTESQTESYHPAGMREHQLACQTATAVHNSKIGTKRRRQ